MDRVGDSSEGSDNEADKSKEFGHGTNVKRQQFNSKQRMDMYAFCVLELELHGGKVSVKKQSQAMDKVLTKCKIEPKNQYLNHKIKSTNVKPAIQLQLSRPQNVDLAQQYQYQYRQQQHLQQLQHQKQQPHVTRVILLKRLPTHTDPQQTTNGTSNNLENVQNVPEEGEQEDEEQYTYEPTTDVIGDHIYSKKMPDFINKDITINNEPQNELTMEKDNDFVNTNSNNNQDISMISNDEINVNTGENMITDTETYSENNLNNTDTETTTNTNENTNENTINNANSDQVSDANTNPNENENENSNANSSKNATTPTTAAPPKPGTRTRTGRKPVKRCKSPDALYNYLEPKALWAHQAWAGRKCYADVQKTQVLTSWMLRNVQQRFAFYYPESAIPSRTTIKHVFQKCISLGTVDNIKNYRKCTKIVDRNSIEQLLLENPNFSLRQLASKLNVSTGTVSRRCKALGLVPDSVTLKHQQLATARRQKQIQALQQEIGISDLLPPKPSTSRQPRSKQRDRQDGPSTSSGPSTSNSPYKYYQLPPPTACNRK